VKVAPAAALRSYCRRGSARRMTAYVSSVDVDGHDYEAFGWVASKSAGGGQLALSE